MLFDDLEFVLNFNLLSFLSDINQLIQALSLKAKKICFIHCWQHMQIVEPFEFDDSVTFTSFFFQWLKQSSAG